MAETDFSQIDRRHMARALELAARGLGRVEPNPMVGAVVARGEQVLAEAWHERFGGPHAEVLALQKAGRAARDATLYVTLEPCCHQGKTPPCADAVVAAQLARAVVAMSDPFPRVAGRGLERLRQAGLQVAVGLMETEARRLNAPFIKLHTVGRPYVSAKWAMTLDGRLAAPSGDSRWISSPQSRQWVHALRSRMDAILIGAGTALKDDPLLTVRLEAGTTDYGRRPARVVLDDQLQLPLGSQLAATAGHAPLIVATRRDANPARADELQKKGAEVLRVPAGPAGLALAPLLEELARRGMTNILVEGGQRVLTSFFAEHQVDRLAVFIAPKLIGGELRGAPAGPPGLELMNEALPLLRPTVTAIGDDALIEGVLRDY